MSLSKSLRSTGMLDKMASVTQKGFLVCGDHRYWGLKSPLIAQLPDSGYTLAIYLEIYSYVAARYASGT